MKRKSHGKINKAVATAILAAMLYGVSSPISKLLLQELSPTFMAALLYLGAGIGMYIVNLIRKSMKIEVTEAKMTRQELPYIIGMIILDILAPILLMMGLTMTSSENVALLNNFEIVATTMIALIFFKEAVGRRMWLAIILITAASIILSVENLRELSFSTGSLFVIAASICWGVENNCTRMLSLKDPLQIVVVKGFGSGIGALIIAALFGDIYGSMVFILLALVLGFIAFGLSIYFYITAQRDLGATRTSTYYAAAPFIGVIMSFLIFREAVSISFFVALIIMVIGTYFVVSENHNHLHYHDRLTHEHKHNHDDGHHNHTHQGIIKGAHNHQHTHEVMNHKHVHTPDMHHQHIH